MSRRKDGQAGRINDTQTSNTADAGIGVEHGHGVVVGAHLAGAGGVENGREAVLDVGPDLLVRGDVLSREVLVADEERLHGGRLPHLAGPLEGGNGDLLVRGMAEPVGVDNGRVGRVVGADGHVAGRQGGDEAGDD